ncbi:hypothetical protein IH992_21425 [Candidatus Poribacteria bacterium]|nr:hypothetical protein [Candidatus Poribacteria bacterium]
MKGTFQGIGGRPIKWQEIEARYGRQLDLRANIEEFEGDLAVAYALTFTRKKRRKPLCSWEVMTKWPCGSMGWKCIVTTSLAVLIQTETRYHVI